MVVREAVTGTRARASSRRWPRGCGCARRRRVASTTGWWNPRSRTRNRAVHGSAIGRPRQGETAKAKGKYVEVKPTSDR